ncbi:MAG: hypothetical protein J1F69_01490 [Clostridiales bacterium]|nr:hypothetical protein [Clostridiales bacterium]
MFGRRRSFDRNDNEQNATGYREKTVFSTDFGSPENSNYQNSGAQGPQDNFGGYAQSGYGDFSQNAAPQNYGYTQSATQGTATQVQDLPMVFASRKHSDIYVYEYPDRVEWYLKTATCMHLFDTQKKQ